MEKLEKTSPKKFSPQATLLVLTDSTKSVTLNMLRENGAEKHGGSRHKNPNLNKRHIEKLWQTAKPRG